MELLHWMFLTSREHHKQDLDRQLLLTSPHAPHSQNWNNRGTITGNWVFLSSLCYILTSMICLVSPLNGLFICSFIHLFIHSFKAISLVHHSFKAISLVHQICFCFVFSWRHGNISLKQQNFYHFFSITIFTSNNDVLSTFIIQDL